MLSILNVLRSFHLAYVNWIKSCRTRHFKNHTITINLTFRYTTVQYNNMIPCYRRSQRGKIKIIIKKTMVMHAPFNKRNKPFIRLYISIVTSYITNQRPSMYCWVSMHCAFDITKSKPPHNCYSLRWLPAYVRTIYLFDLPDEPPKTFKLIWFVWKCAWNPHTHTHSSLLINEIVNDFLIFHGLGWLPC